VSAFIDMDGVLADFMGSAMRRHNRLDMLENYPKGVWALESHMGISASEFWEPLKGHDFWADLQPYPWFDYLIGLIRARFGENWWISTSPCLDPGSASGKVEWLQRYMPGNDGKTFTRYFIGTDKYHLARRGAVLIDDNETNCRKFEAFGGTAILFPAPWNCLHDLGGNPVRYVQNALDLLGAGMVTA
jgi:5'(3')-deoxyribonucleotidase